MKKANFNVLVPADLAQGIGAELYSSVNGKRRFLFNYPINPEKDQTPTDVVYKAFEKYVEKGNFDNLPKDVRDLLELYSKKNHKKLLIAKQNDTGTRLEFLVSIS